MSDASRLSIGAVASATGIPAATLRTWERRYGFPDPRRTESGHRRYSPDILERLRLTARLIDAGHRASEVVGLSEADLDEFLSQTSKKRPPVDDAPGAPGDAPDEPWLEVWIQAAETLDDSRLETEFRTAWNRLGAHAFMTSRATPFLRRIGALWAAGEMTIAHEHHATEKLRDFLSHQWRSLHEGTSEPRVICATPRHELHGLGLQFVAVTFAMADWKVAFIGPDTPLDDIEAARRDAGAEAVAVSIVGAYDTERAEDLLCELAARAPDETDVVAGGSGAPEELPGVRTFGDLGGLRDWAAGYTG